MDVRIELAKSILAFLLVLAAAAWNEMAMCSVYNFWNKTLHLSGHCIWKRALIKSKEITYFVMMLQESALFGEQDCSGVALVARRRDGSLVGHHTQLVNAKPVLMRPVSFLLIIWHG